MLNTQTVANTFIMLGYKENILITPMKLQKLVYLLYKRYLQSTGCKLFEEPFCKWKYGPVVPSIYYEFKDFKSAPITKFARNAQNGAEMIDLSRYSQVQEAVYDVWNKYKKYSAAELSALTHKAGSAWSRASITLSDEDIKNEPEFC